ncbi:hypothetical protein AAHU66_12425 [Klebsiella pneumoniae]
MFFSLSVLNLEDHLGLVISPQSPLSAGYITLRACRRSLPLRFSTVTPGGIVGFLIVSYPNRAFLLLAPGWIRTDMGGSNGAFSLEEAIPDIIKTIEQKQGKPGLEYLDRFGKTIPW